MPLSQHLPATCTVFEQTSGLSCSGSKGLAWSAPGSVSDDGVAHGPFSAGSYTGGERSQADAPWNSGSVSQPLMSANICAFCLSASRSSGTPPSKGLVGICTGIRMVLQALTFWSRLMARKSLWIFIQVRATWSVTSGPHTNFTAAGAGCGAGDFRCSSIWVRVPRPTMVSSGWPGRTMPKCALYLPIAFSVDGPKVPPGSVISSRPTPGRRLRIASIASWIALTWSPLVRGRMLCASDARQRLRRCCTAGVCRVVSSGDSRRVLMGGVVAISTSSARAAASPANQPAGRDGQPAGQAHARGKGIAGLVQPAMRTPALSGQRCGARARISAFRWCACPSRT